MNIVDGQERSRLTRSAALASSALAVTLLGLKGWAALATGSVSMLGSLADTALDLLASLLTLYAVGFAAQPADAEHRFGHGKAEAIAALMQTLLILGSAVAIIWRAVLAFGMPAAEDALIHPLPRPAPRAGGRYRGFGHRHRADRGVGRVAARRCQTHRIDRHHH